MGTCFVRVEAAVDKGEEEEEDLRLDNRKRNSLVFSVIDWVETGFGTRARAAIFAAIASRRQADAAATVFVYIAERGRRGGSKADCPRGDWSRRRRGCRADRGGSRRRRGCRADRGEKSRLLGGSRFQSI